MAECQFKGCEEEAVGYVEIRLPDDPATFTVIAEDQRIQRAHLCQEHIDMVSGGALSGMVELASDDDQSDEARG